MSPDFGGVALVVFECVSSERAILLVLSCQSHCGIIIMPSASPRSDLDGRFSTFGLN